MTSDRPTSPVRATICLSLGFGPEEYRARIALPAAMDRPFCGEMDRVR